MRHLLSPSMPSRGRWERPRICDLTYVVGRLLRDVQRLRAAPETDVPYVPLAGAADRLGMSGRLVLCLIADDELTVQVRSSDVERLLAVRAKIAAGLDGVTEPLSDDEDLCIG